jgi:DNA mismatch repair ATPase MutL
LGGPQLATEGSSSFADLDQHGTDRVGAANAAAEGADAAVAQSRSAFDREQLLNDLLSLTACHAAVRAGDRLTPEEIAALLEQRELARDSHHCPHGRPTSLLFTLAELGKQFRRT